MDESNLLWEEEMLVRYDKYIPYKSYEDNPSYSSSDFSSRTLKNIVILDSSVILSFVSIKVYWIELKCWQNANLVGTQKNLNIFVNTLYSMTKNIHIRKRRMIITAHLYMTWNAYLTMIILNGIQKNYTFICNYIVISREALKSTKNYINSS